MRRALLIICSGLISMMGGCRYFDVQHQPTGFSSTHHKYEVQEKVREWHARQERQKKLAELRRRLAKKSPGNQDKQPSEVVKNKMNGGRTPQ